MFRQFQRWREDSTSHRFKGVEALRDELGTDFESWHWELDDALKSRQWDAAWALASKVGARVDWIAALVEIGFLDTRLVLDLRGALLNEVRGQMDELRGEQRQIDFGSQIRSYTLHPQQRVKDHRTSVEMGNVQAVLEGDLDRFIRATLLQRATGEGAA